MKFLEECSQPCNLDDLYSFDGQASTCAYNAKMPFTPIQVKIQSEELKKHYDNKNMLLQVWHKGKNIFQKELFNPIKKWAICFQYFIYKTEKDPKGRKQFDDEKHDFFRIVNLQTMGITEVRDFLPEVKDPKDEFTYFAFNENKFFAANRHQIKIAALKLHKKKDTTILRSINKTNLSTIYFKKEPVQEVPQQEQVQDLKASEYLNRHKPQVQKKVASDIKEPEQRPQGVVHGLAVPETGLSDSLDLDETVLEREARIKGGGSTDFIYVFVEVTKDDDCRPRISMNKLFITEEKMGPYAQNDQQNSFYQFFEYREYISEKIAREQTNNKDEAIAEYKYVFNHDYKHVGVAVRENKHFDIYYDGICIDGAKVPNDPSKREKCKNCVVTYDYIFIEAMGKKPGGEGKKTRQLQLNHNTIFSNAKNLLQNEQNFQNFVTERFKHTVKLFSGLILIETNVFVSHGSHLSQFYLSTDSEQSTFKLNPKSIEEFKFDHEIAFIFKEKKFTEGFECIEQHAIFSVGVLLTNGDIYKVESDNMRNYDSWIKSPKKDSIPLFVTKEETTIQVGDILGCYSDPVTYKAFLFLARTPKDAVDHLEEIDNEEEADQQEGQIVEKADKQSPVEPEQASNQSGTEIRAYVWIDDRLVNYTRKLRSEGVETHEDDQFVGVYERNTSIPHIIYYCKSLKKIFLFAVSVVKQANPIANWVNKVEPGRMQAKEYSIKKLAETSLDPKELLKQFDTPAFKKQLGWGARDKEDMLITNVVHDKTMTLVFSKYNCYKFVKNERTKKLSCVVLPNICWRSFYLSDNKHLYLISDKKEQIHKGLAYFDIDRYIGAQPQKQAAGRFKDLTTYLQPAQVGIQSQLDYSHGIERLGYIKDYQKVVLIPNLHLNQISLIDQCEFECILAVQQIQDAFYVLHQKGEDQVYLTTWDLVTGKKMKTVDSSVPGCKGIKQYTEYSRFNKGHDDSDPNISGLRDKHLLVCNKPQEFSESMLPKYFKKEQMEARFDNQTTFVKGMGKNDPDTKEFRKFKLIEIKDQDTVKEHYQFTHPMYAEYQELFFNQSADQMIEFLSHDRVNLYKKDRTRMGNISNYGTPEVNFRHEKRMTFLSNPVGRNDVLESVSPDFTNFIYIDKAKKCFKIMDLVNEQEIHADKQVPKYIMNYGQNPGEALLRFCWVGEDMIKVINQEGIEKLVDVANGEYSQLGFNTLCNYNHQEERHRSFYFDRAPLAQQEVMQRLIRRCQHYKSAQLLGPKEVETEINLHESMFVIDFQGSKKAKKFFSDMSFSYITWRNIEALSKGDISVEDLDDTSIDQLIFSIVPGGQTFLHCLYDKPEDINSILNKLVEEAKGDKGDEIRYSFPYLQDLNGLCPVKLCLESDQMKSINYMLKYFRSQPLDHHSRYISQILPELLEKDLNNFPEYLESLTKKTQLIKSFEREIINDKNPHVGIMVTDFWTQKRAIKETLFKEIKKDKTAQDDGDDGQQRVSDIEMFFIDAPHIHEFGEPAKQFFEKLSQTDKLELFDLHFVQQQINFKWPIVKEAYLWQNFVPSILQLVTMWFFTTFLMHDKLYGQEGDYWILAFDIQLLQFVLALYIFWAELKQMSELGIWEYWSDFWNWIDVSAPVIVIIMYIFCSVVPMREMADNPTYLNIYSTAMSVATLTIWIKVLYFLRIFESTGFLVRAIVEVIRGMAAFFFIYLIIIVAFGDATKVIARANNEGEGYFDDNNPIKAIFATYLVSLGEFALDDFGKVSTTYLNILFFLASMFCMVIMLNLFIAIISAEFDKVNQQNKRASYREKAGLIYENMAMIDMEKRREWAEEDKYILFVKDLKMEAEQELSTEFKIEQSMGKQTKELQHDINMLERNLDSLQKGFIDEMHKVNEKIAEISAQKTEEVQQVTGLQQIKFKPGDYKVVYENLDSPAYKSELRKNKKMQKGKTGLFGRKRNQDKNAEGPNEDLEVAEDQPRQSTLGPAALAGGLRDFGSSVVGGVTDAAGQGLSAVANLPSLPGQPFKNAIGRFVELPLEQQLEALFSCEENQLSQLLRKKEGHHHHVIDFERKHFNESIRGIGLKSGAHDVKSCPSTWTLSLQAENDDKFKEVLKIPSTQFTAPWQTQMFMIPGAENGLKFKKLRLEVLETDRHVDFSLGEIIIFK